MMIKQGIIRVDPANRTWVENNIPDEHRIVAVKEDTLSVCGVRLFELLIEGPDMPEPEPGRPVPYVWFVCRTMRVDGEAQVWAHWSHKPEKPWNTGLDGLAGLKGLG